MDYIQGEKFIRIADLVYAPTDNRTDDYTHIVNTLTTDNCLEYNPCVVYTHTFYVEQLFDFIKDINHRFVIITHNCDINVDKRFSPPDKVIKWFSQNVNTFHDKITAIPIGLQNDHWNVYGNKMDVMDSVFKTPKRIRNLLYLNHNSNTNPAQRSDIYGLFKNKKWATLDYHTQNFSRFEEYISNIYNHKFIVCPEGNGVDTHRVWEALYMDTIPIVKRGYLSDNLYSFFPVLIVNKWDDITEDLLNKEYEDIESIKAYYDKDQEMLTFEYWKNKIRGTR